MCHGWYDLVVGANKNYTIKYIMKLKAKLQYVEIDLRFDCFSHGHLYVGFSRTGSSENQFIWLPHGLQTKNVVYSEILWEQYFKM